MNRSVLAVATGVAISVFGALPGDAAYIGNAPWCAVVNLPATSNGTANMARLRPASRMSSPAIGAFAD
jgi:hypothetical protein